MSKRKKIANREVKVLNKKKDNKLLSGRDYNTKLIEDKSRVLQLEIEGLNRKIAELNDKLLRKIAEYDNTKKIIEKDNNVKFEKFRASFFLDLISILDNFDRAIEHIEEKEENAGILNGIKIIDKNFHDFLEKYGVVPYKSLGEKFNPQEHEAISVVNNEKYNNGVIVEEYAKGYRMDGKILRAAKVIVNQLTEKIND